MSNILIIKHGSLGDIVQISGVLEDIKKAHASDSVYILTTTPYVELLSKCPHIDGVIIDKRLPRWNLFFLLRLKKMIKKFDFSKVYDLQNSARTSFYRKFVFNISSWNSTETTLKKNIKKKDFNKNSVLERFKLQLLSSGLSVENTLKPDFSWACTNVDKIINKYTGKKIILILPFCSPKLSHKKWPYYNELLKIIKNKHNNLETVIAPSPEEIQESKEIDAVAITNDKKALNIMELAGLVKKSSYVIGNDTGPAHMAAHLGKKGIVLFGHHTSPEKVSIETENFKAISIDNLSKLTAEKVYLAIKDKLELIN